ncbi:hypothetical protein NLG97_g643 [Lecanicillium saksenae]|uniref:Uncharacterized protein n=1 Tax=Lecanicillium saksenae TaxID=468837 RepID=A0ACC1RA48_9HYPO|nr:hypothetical protein NLG97_g643 [Lecanicillium saksenae]
MSHRISGEDQTSALRALAAHLLIQQAHKAYEKYRRTSKRNHIDSAVDFAAGAIRSTIAPPASWSLNLAHYLNCRYEQLRHVDDLDRAVLVTRRGIVAAREDYERKASLLNTLAALFLSRYMRRKAFVDLKRAVRAAKQALANIPRRNRSLRPVFFNTLASVWNHIYTHTGKSKFLDLAVQATRNAVSCSATSDPFWSFWVHNYLILLNRRFTLYGSIGDLERAISEAEGVVLDLADNNPLKPEILSALGAQLNIHYEYTKDTIKLSKAIQFGRQAVELAANDAPRKAIYLGNLSNSLVSRHRLTSDRQDLEEAIRRAELAAASIPEGHESEMEVLQNLATKRLDLYRWTGQHMDFESTIEEMRLYLDSTSINHHSRAARLDDIASLLLLHYEKTGILKSLKEAIELSERAVQTTPAKHPDQSIYVGNLGYYYANLYDSTQNMAHLNLAWAYAKLAAEITPKTCIHYSTTLGRFAGVLERISERTGSLDDLHEAIRVTTEAANASPNDSMEKATELSDLGNLLEKQYLRTGAIVDLHEAISRSKQAVQVTKSDHSALPGRLNNLAIKLMALYTRTRVSATINEALEHASGAVGLTSRNHLDWAMYTSTLSSVLHSRYETLSQQQDLARAIEHERMARDAVPKDHALRMTYQHNLGISLATLHEMSLNEAHLSEAIGLVIEAVNLAPQDSPVQAGRKNTLASLLETRYRQAKQRDIRNEVLRLSLDVWNCTAAVPFERIRAGYRALRMFAEELRAEEQTGNTPSETDLNPVAFHPALCLGAAILDLLPVVHTRYLDRKDQQFVVSSFSGVASLAASLFLKAEMATDAIECLERGRTVIINQLLNDRKDISDLERTHPALATRYTRLVSELNLSFGSKLQAINTTHKDTVKELDACIADIRAVSGSSMLHLAQSVPEMQQNIGARLVIFVNVSEFASHAIILSKERLIPISLPKLTASEAKKMFNRTWVVKNSKKQSEKHGKLLKALEWLWDACVEPILLSVSPVPSTNVEALPRVWWIGCGYASSLPFHAAESRRTGSTGDAFSRVVSSYTPSIMSLTHTIQGSSGRRYPKEGKAGLLLATMATTPSAGRLYDDLEVAKEANSVIQSAGSHIMVELLEHPDVKQVSEGLKTCHIAHFACHGEVDRHDPSNTALVFRRRGTDGHFEPDLLTAQEILGLNLDHAYIAYLSACSTSENRARGLTDEVIHLASGFLVAGFPNVIGSLWQARDCECAKLASYFYSQLFNQGQSDDTEDVAVTLHKAIQRMRSAQLKAPANWAQFVHWGI